MTSESAGDLAAILEGLLAEAAGTDLLALRSERLGALNRTEKKELAATVAALDTLLATLEERERSIADGEVEPWAGETTPEVAAAEVDETPPSEPPSPEQAEAVPPAEEVPPPTATEPDASKAAARKRETADMLRTLPPAPTMPPAPEIEAAPPAVPLPESKPVEAIEPDPVEAIEPDPVEPDLVVTREELPAVEPPHDAAPPTGDSFHDQATRILPALSEELIEQMQEPEEAGGPSEARAVTDQRKPKPAQAEPVAPPPIAPFEDEAVAMEDAQEMAAHGAAIAEEEIQELPMDALEDRRDTNSGLRTLESAPEVPADAAVPDAPAPDPEGAGPIADEEPTPGWTRSSELLFDDALRLFRLGDSDGALISLERLLSTNDLNDDLQEFVRLNEDRLLDLYHAIVGPWEKVPVLDENNEEPMPRVFLAEPKIDVVLGMIDGESTMQQIMDGNDTSRLETVAVLSQLLRARTITVFDS